MHTQQFSDVGTSPHPESIRVQSAHESLGTGRSITFIPSRSGQSTIRLKSEEKVETYGKCDVDLSITYYLDPPPP